MHWLIEFTAKAAKGRSRLPQKIRDRLDALVRAIQFGGPIQPSMPHFGTLKNRPGDWYHCHLNKGRPVYVVVWQIKNKKTVLIEVTSVGSHEKVPY